MRPNFTQRSLLAMAALVLVPSSLLAQEGRILFIRGGSGTGGFLGGGSDEQLSDLFEFGQGNGNHGFGELGVELQSQGFDIEQMIEGPANNNTPIPFESMDLSVYDVIVLGSNNADYGSAAVDAVEEWVRAGGGLLAISDANWGSDWGSAPSSDQSFLVRFGWTMNQDRGTYSLIRQDGDYVIGGVDMGAHPIVAGPEGALGDGDDVDRFDGEGVSPITFTQVVPGVQSQIVAGAQGQIRVNDDPDGGSSRSANDDDAALIVAQVGCGRVVGHFDRNTFFNLNGAGTSLSRFDNRTYARNLFAFLADRSVRNYCTATANSTGTAASISASGSISIAANAFGLRAEGAVPGQPGLFFYGPEAQDVPFADGRRCVGDGGVGFFRLPPPQVIAPDGSANRNVDFQASPADSGPGQLRAGDTWYFQFWYRDPLAMGTGSNLSLAPY